MNNGTGAAGNAPLRKIRAAFSRQSSSSQEDTSRRKVGESTKSGTAQGNQVEIPNGTRSPATLSQMRGGINQHGQVPQPQHGQEKPLEQKQQYKVANKKQQPPALMVVQPRMGIGSAASNGGNNTASNDGGSNVHPTAQTATILTIELVAISMGCK
jgi:hypothetical protein